MIKNDELSRYSQRFKNNDLENEYQALNQTRSLFQLRVAVLVGAVVNMGFSTLEFTLLDHNKLLAIGLRWTIVGVFFATFALTYFLDFRRFGLAISALAVFSFSVLYAAIVIIADPPDIYITGYVLAILFTLNFVPFGFVATTILTAGATVTFLLLIWQLGDLANDMLIILLVQFFAAMALGIVPLIWLERLHRRDFINLRNVATERSRYQNLLGRIFPAEIARRSQLGESDIADDYDDATVLFADIVGFTMQSQRYRPSEIAKLLNRVFLKFDELVEANDVEKIKTVGDAYLVAGGVPKRSADHPEKIANLALQMIAAMEEVCWPDGSSIDIRIGIHSGPLVAGVIGDSRFSYDIWGDTVNTAQRMESTGHSGSIQVSDDFKSRLEGMFVFEGRGKIDVKSKGQMHTWFLVGKLDAEQKDA